jgi:short subunit dehydrogenase-like uncharacterized protein
VSNSPPSPSADVRKRPKGPRTLIYGAYGYSGELIAREAVQLGLQPVLAGRDPERLARLGSELGCPVRGFSLDDQNATFRALEEIAIVLNCAGPFTDTAPAMMQACLASKAHYLDITGEIDVFELAKSLDGNARRSGVVLCPGVGFDVVATDCLAALLQEALPQASYLALGFDTRGAPSPGTARTMLRGLALGGRIRSAGRLLEVALVYRPRRIDFGRGATDAMTIPWGDVSTAYTTTGIPNIEVYVPMSRSALRRLRLAALARPLIRIDAVRSVLERRVASRVPGPGEAARAASPVYVWGEVRDPQGETRVARMRTANGYTFTRHAAVGILRELLARPHAAGYATPSMLVGAGFAASLPGSSTPLISQA